jgi:CHC2 zinc finger
MSWNDGIFGCIPEGLGLRVVREHKGGEELACICPFHDDHEPSFFFNTVTTQWHCFACGEKGNAITLAQETLSCSRDEARSYLVTEHGAEFSRVTERDAARDAAKMRRRHGAVLSGRKPGVSKWDWIQREKRILDVAFAGLFPVGKREANYVIRNLIDEGKLALDEHGFVRPTPRHTSPLRRGKLPTPEPRLSAPTNCPPEGFRPDPFAIHDPDRQELIRRRQKRRDRLRWLE